MFLSEHLNIFVDIPVNFNDKELKEQHMTARDVFVFKGNVFSFGSVKRF